MKFSLCAVTSFFGLYKCGTIKSEKKAEPMTIAAAKMPRSRNASLFTKSRHKNANAVVDELMNKGFVMISYVCLMSTLCL